MDDGCCFYVEIYVLIYVFLPHVNRDRSIIFWCNMNAVKIAFMFYIGFQRIFLETKLTDKVANYKRFLKNDS